MKPNPSLTLTINSRRGWVRLGPNDEPLSGILALSASRGAAALHPF